MMATDELRQSPALGSLILQNVSASGFISITMGAAGAAEWHRPFMVPPPPDEQIFGRDGLVEDLVKQLVDAPDGACFGLWGIPGIGKSTLANKIARHPLIAERFNGGVLWAGLGQNPEVQDFLLTCTLAVGEPLQVADAASIERRRALIEGRLGARRVLFVIDDVWERLHAREHLLGGRCVHLLTTRRPDVARKIARTHAIEVPELSGTVATKMLASYAPEAVGRFRDLAARAVEAAAGLPMMLSLIGGRLATAAPGDLDSIQRALEEAIKYANEGLEPYIDASVQELAENERRALHALSLFRAKPDDFSKAAALAVANCAFGTLKRLVDAGLLEGPRDESEDGRFSLHSSIADYSANCLEPKDASAAEARMIRHYAEFMEEVGAEGRDDRSVMAREMVNIEAALARAMADERYDRLLARGANAYGEFLRTRGLNHRAEPYCRAALESAERLSDEDAVANARLSLAHLLEKFGSYQEAKEELDRYAGSKARTPLRSARAHYIRAVVEFNLSDYAGAGRQVTKGIDVLKTYERGQGISVLSPSRPKTSRDHHRARELYCDLLERRCLVHMFNKDWNRARADADEGLLLARSLGDRCREAEHLLNFAWLLLRIAEAQEEQAASTALFGYKLATQLAHREYELGFLHRLGCTAAKFGNRKRAEEYFSRALISAQDIRHQWYVAALNLDLGRLYWLEGDKRAWANLHMAAEVAARIGNRDMKQTAERMLGGQSGAVEPHPVPPREVLAAETESVIGGPPIPMGRKHRRVTKLTALAPRRPARPKTKPAQPGAGLRILPARADEDGDHEERPLPPEGPKRR